MVGVAKNNMATDIHAQLDGFRRSDEARERLLVDLLEECDKLRQQNLNLSSDLENETNSRRMLQGEIRDFKTKLSFAERATDGGAFVLALVDGDGAIFQDTFLSAIQNGGSEAASRLYQEIRSHLSKIYPETDSSSWPIMVHIYASLDKLGLKLTSVGLIKSPADFRAFAQSFSVNQPMFSIIDVGQGKERADHRIKEMLRTFIPNPTCKHIIFGGCHDTGYLLNLDMYKHDLSVAKRITLLASTEPPRGFSELPNFHRARFTSVFRSELLPESGFPARPVLPPTTTANMVPSSPAVASPANSSPQLVNASVSSPNSSHSSSWAAVGQNGNIVSNVSIAPTKKSRIRRYILQTADYRRLDEPLPQKDYNAMIRFKKRMGENGAKFCNNWHLNNGKCYNSNCHYIHEPKLPAGELNILKHKARTLNCTPSCENIECYLGHQCSIERDRGKGACQFENCSHSSTHGKDMTPGIRQYEDGGFETLVD